MLLAVSVGMLLCVSGLLMMFIAGGLGFALLFAGFLVFACIPLLGLGLSGSLRSKSDKRAADDGGASELGFILRSLDGNRTPFGQPLRREPGGSAGPPVDHGRDSDAGSDPTATKR